MKFNTLIFQILAAIFLIVSPSGCVTQDSVKNTAVETIRVAEKPVEKINPYNSASQQYVIEGLHSIASKLMVSELLSQKTDKKMTRFVFGVIVFVSKTSNMNVMYELSGVIDLHRNGAISSFRAVGYVGKIMKRYSPEGEGTVKYLWFIGTRTVLSGGM